MRRFIVVLLASIALAGSGIPEQAPSQQAPQATLTADTTDSTTPTEAPTDSTTPAGTPYAPYAGYVAPATNSYGQPFTPTEKEFLRVYYRGVDIIMSGHCSDCGGATVDTPIISDTDRVEYGHVTCDLLTSGKTGLDVINRFDTALPRTDPPRHMNTIVLVSAAVNIMCPENKKQLGAR